MIFSIVCKIFKYKQMESSHLDTTELGLVFRDRALELASNLENHLPLLPSAGIEGVCHHRPAIIEILNMPS